jgi:hypothetical protein
MKSTACIVVYDDKQGLCVPYGDDDDCAGALSTANSIRVFPNRQDAKKAIRISVAFAKLCREQGKPVNTDFLDGITNVTIMPCVGVP